jgi:meso-butanediol dehydrogenase/(S,S)-butanediol dehydrogenase/diacetyl reductase
MRLKDKVVVMTGATGGTGVDIVKAFVAEGAKVIASDLNQAQVDELASQFDGQVKGVTCDIQDYSQVQALIDGAVEHFGTFDVMINHAGMGTGTPLLDHDPAKDWDPVVNICQKGTYHGILTAARKLVALKKPGVILNTSSAYGTMAAEFTFSYNGAKAAVDMMTKSAALELAPHNIRCIAISPGRVDTPLLRNFEKMGLWQHIQKDQMRGGFSTTTDLASIYAFLASDESNCINGCTIDAGDGFFSFKHPMVPPGCR